MATSVDLALLRQITTAGIAVYEASRRAGSLLAKGRQVAAQAETLLRAAGLTYLLESGALPTPLSSSTPAEDLVDAYIAIQQGYADLKVGLDGWAEQAGAAGDWPTAATALDALHRIDPQYRDVAARLSRAQVLGRAVQALEAPAWEAARELLEPWCRDHATDTVARDLLCETYYRPAVQAADAGDAHAIPANLASLRQLNPNYQDLARWPQRFPHLTWFISEIKAVHQFGAHTGAVVSVAFSPDGQLLATACHDGTAQVWEVSSARLLHTLAHGGPSVHGVAFSPDGQLLATAGHDGTAKVWEVSSARLLHTLAHQSAYVIGVAFSPDGRLLATAGDAGTAKVWEVSSARLLHTLAHGGPSVHGVAFSPDGQLLATAGHDGTARLWGPQ